MSRASPYKGVNMRPVVLYIDDHHAYQSRLTRRLDSLSGGAYEIAAIRITHEIELRNAVGALAQHMIRRITVALGPRHISLNAILDLLPELTIRINFCERENDERADTPSFASRKQQKDTRRKFRSDRRMDNDAREGVMEIRTVSRFGRVTEIDAIIRRHITVGPPVRDAGNLHSNSIGTHLSFSHKAGTRITRYVIGKERALGHTVVYLPIKPLYKIEGRFRRGSGLTFGDLIYRFSEGDFPDINDMGQWLYMHENGYYTVTLPERSDDLITCDIGTLKQITNAWRDYTHTRSQPTTSWIDIEGMPLCDVLELAVLCDFIYVDAPVGNADKEAVARRELGLFMAQLPKECVILELPHGNRSLTETNHSNQLKESHIASRL